jgi:hypothetical protein
MAVLRRPERNEGFFRLSSTPTKVGPLGEAKKRGEARRKKPGSRAQQKTSDARTTLLDIAVRPKFFSNKTKAVC